jgi:DNA helicase-2/ATP-dependent DNA helicase PcrA
MSQEFRPRPGQRQVLAYSGGKMGISAVPGSGKTQTLAVLAAQLVETAIAEDQEVLVVTLVNSAVDNFRRRISDQIGSRGLLRDFGYRVRTLHGLAHDLVRERPGLVGLSEDFGIIDEREADAVREDAVEAWLRAHPDAAEPFLALDLEGSRAEWVQRNRWPSVVRDVAAAFIKQAKDLQLAPEVVLAHFSGAALAERGGAPEFRLARLGAEIYGNYQRSLAWRGVVDFDDLIRLALDALQRDPDYLARQRHRWPYVLEDEAQDSSRLQEEILSLLVGEHGNWVRVGDPNQAIYETFTTADPRLLQRFIRRDEEVAPRELPESGRSQPAIIELANHLIDWVRTEHPTPEARRALTLPHIGPTPPGDPQPNPPADPAAVQFVDHEYTPEAELRVVADSLERWSRQQALLPERERETCAVLAPRNQRGFQLIDLLKAKQIPYVELLRSTSITRQTAGALGNLLSCLADPASARKLSVAFRVWRRDGRDDPEEQALTEHVVERIKACPAVEAYLWPRADHDWLAPLRSELAGPELALLEEFRPTMQRWHRAAPLPIDQLILTLASDLFREAAELALAHKLALLLREVAAGHPGYRLAELVEELAVIARNERRFLGFAAEESGFEPPAGMVTVATMHKAKGLEWDRVYLMSVNNYNFPSGLAHDVYLSEPWFIRDSLNLPAEALAQLQALVNPEGRRLPLYQRASPAAGTVAVREGAATRQARLDYVTERLRLLYVGITRARRALVVTWNTGRRRGDKLQPAVPFLALHDYWQRRLAEEDGS